MAQVIELLPLTCDTRWIFQFPGLAWACPGRGSIWGKGSVDRKQSIYHFLLHLDSGWGAALTGTQALAPLELLSAAPPCMV